jgi:hypothetical protein
MAREHGHHLARRIVHAVRYSSSVTFERPEERFVRGVLESDGFNVERIDEDPQGKRADFRAQRGAERYLVEVKKIDEGPRMVVPTEVTLWDIPLGYRNKLAGVARDASVQLLGTPTAQDEPLRVVWFVATGLDANARVDQLRATLYGAVDLIWEMDGRGARSKPCYFFTFAEFRRRPELDVAIIGTGGQGQLCLNPFGARVDLVRGCSLWQLFGEGVVDPEADEERGGAFLADFSGDRRDEEAMLALVKQKYELEHLFPFKPTQHTGMAWVGVPEPDDHKPT